MLAWLQIGTKRTRTATDSDDDTALQQSNASMHSQILRRKTKSSLFKKINFVKISIIF